MHIFSFMYLIVFSVLTITAFLEDALRIFEECLPKIGEVKTCIQWVLSLTFVDFVLQGEQKISCKIILFRSQIMHHHYLFQY